MYARICNPEGMAGDWGQEQNILGTLAAGTGGGKWLGLARKHSSKLFINILLMLVTEVTL